MSEPFLCIRNRHLPECGDPPIINNDDPQLYVGYFETRDREQWVFTYQAKTGEAVLRGGDCDWSRAFRIEHDELKDVFLEKEVRQWLDACMSAALRDDG